MKKISGKKKFWLGFGIYMGVLLIAVIVVFFKTWSSMKKYENAQPDKVMDRYLDTLKGGDVSLVKTGAAGAFEPELDFSADIKNAVTGKDISYANALTGTDTMKYAVKDESGNEILEVTLKSTNDRKVLGFLTVSDWVVDDAVAKTGAGNESVTITIPSIYYATVNGIKLSKENMVGDPSPVDDAEYIATYVNAPEVVTYKVEGLYNKPEVKVYNNSDAEIDITAATDGNKVKVGFATQDMPQELMDYTYQAALAYSNFFSRDLEGCSESTACLQPYFPVGSYYIDLAEQYRTGDMWMYSAHNYPEFTNVSVSEYTPYTEDCFSCRVIFDKSMYLTNTGETRVEHNDQTYYYVNIEGNWLIADIRTSSEQ